MNISKFLLFTLGEQFKNVRTASKQTLKMNIDKAYLRHMYEVEQFEITFQYVNPQINVNRQFNLLRRSTEPVSTFLSRVKTNVEKVIAKKKKKTPDLDDVKIDLFVDNVKVEEYLTCQEVFVPDKNIVLAILDNRFTVIVNSPWVNTVSLPTSLLSGFPIYLKKCELSFTNKCLSQFIWYKSKDKQKWISIGGSYVYTPSQEDVDSYLKVACIPKNGTVEGPIAEVISTVKVEATPEKFPFEYRHQFTKSKLEGKSFRVVSYNTLADLYCDSDYTRTVLFPYCPPTALVIDYRKQLILKELLGYNADIICLQEMDKKVFKEFKEIFSDLGFGGCLSLKGGEILEGLACFYDRRRFREIETIRIVLSDDISINPIFSSIWDKVSRNEKLSQRLANRSTTLQVVILESVDDNELLIVANTHLYFHPESDNIRLLQGGFNIMYLEDLHNKLKSKHSSKRVSLIFCGDFNSTPDCGIYKLYTEGCISENCVDFHSNNEEIVDGIRFIQNLHLKSACGTPKYTNFTPEFSECIDYIYYEDNNLKVTQIVPFPDIVDLTKGTALPSTVFPSDHISLISDFSWA